LIQHDGATALPGATAAGNATSNPSKKGN